MPHKSHTMLFALTGSLILVMLFSAIGFSPRTEAMEGESVFLKSESDQSTLENIKNFIFHSPSRTSDFIQAEIDTLVRNNQPDKAKKLYDELYVATH